MENNIRKNGFYELYLTIQDRQMLCLDQKEWYTIVEGQGKFLIKSDQDQKSKALAEGNYTLVYFQDDPEFNDMLHLFLEKKCIYEEWILTSELPAHEGDRVKVVVTKNLIDALKIDEYIEKRLMTKERAQDKETAEKNDSGAKLRNELYESAKEKRVTNTTIKIEGLTEE